MMRDITIGQYYPVDSIIHRLDPRTKLMGTFCFIVSLFLIRKTVWYLALLIWILVLFRLSRVPLSYFTKGLRNIVILLVFTFFFRMVITPGDVLAAIWIFEITKEGVQQAVHLTSRIGLMVTGASLLGYTSTPRSLADGLEKSFSFLEKIGIPVSDMALMTMIAFRFIPVMLEEANLIMDAQAARGVEFEQASIWKKMRNVFTLVFPLFMSSIRRSADLATAMEARGFSGEVRPTRMHPLEYKSSDAIGYIISAAMLAGAVALRVIG